MRTVVSLVALLLSLPALGADRPWRMLQTPHYTVLSQMADLDTTQWAREYDQFLSSTLTLLQLEPRRLTPLTVVLFARSKDFAPYQFSENIAGQFMRRPTFSLISLARDVEDDATRTTIFHEGTHWLMSVDPRRQPAWFTEGIAEMFSTFERKGDYVNWAKPISYHLGQMRMVKSIPLEDFLTRRSALSESNVHTGRYYSQSWTFVHFMMLSKDTTRRQKLFDFLAAYRSGSADAAVKKVFGEDLSAWESEFDAYIRQRSFAYIKLPVQPAAPLPAITDAPAALVESTLGLIALGSDKLELAQQHADRALALDAKSPRAHDLLAYMAVERERDADVARHAQAAIAAGSRDSQMHLFHGDSFLFEPNSGMKDAARQRASSYENAINLSPARLISYEKLISALGDIETPTTEDAKFLDVGLRIFPDEDWLKVGAAQTAEKLGQQEQAARYMLTALRADSSLDRSQRDYAEHVQLGWSTRSLNETIRASVQKRDFAAARTAVEAEKAKFSGNAEAERMFTTMLANIGNVEQVDLAMQAANAGRGAEALKLIDEVLAKPNLPPELRSRLTQMRSRLPK